MLVIAVVGLLATPSSQAHFANFTADVYFNCSIGYTSDCFWKPTNAVYHSYGFNSAVAKSNQYVCPSIWGGGGRTYECGFGFERYCYQAWTHSSNDLDCHDQDGVSFLSSTYYGGPYSAGAAAYTQQHPNW
ncbi:MAG: hypothetical protein ACR2GL_03885 [Thermoleophilaceae bacterium]